MRMTATKQIEHANQRICKLAEVTRTAATAASRLYDALLWQWLIEQGMPAPSRRATHP